MIRLSRLTDYAVALLSHMGKADPFVLWTAPDLTAASGLALPTVSKIMKMLAKSGVISAHRGAAGGYRLALAPTSLSVARIIEAMDGPIAITDCSEGSRHATCAMETTCPMSQGWNKVNLAVRQALDAVSLADMGTLAIHKATHHRPASRIHAKEIA